MTNLRWTADHHVVPPLNIRPVESGIIPDHFSTSWKTDPAHHDLSERARPTPAVRHTLSPIKARSLPIRPFFQSGAGESGGWSALWCERALSYIHTRQPTNPRPMPTNFYGLVGYDRAKNYPLWLKSVSIPDQSPLYPRCIPDAPTLKSRSSRPTPVLPADQSPLCTTNPRPIPDATTLTTLNIGPTPDLISIPGLKWIIQANVMPTDSVMWVQYPKCAHGPYC